MTAIQKFNVDTLVLPSDVTLLADNTQYTNRFDFASASGNVYRIAQNISGRWWACSCPAWKFNKGGKRDCKHLRDFGLPGSYQSFEVGHLAVASESDPPRAIGAVSMTASEKAARAGGAPAPTAAAGGDLLLVGNTFAIRDEIKKAGGKWDADAKGWRMPNQAAFDRMQSLLGGSRPAANTPVPVSAPKALPAVKPIGLEMADGKIVVTFDAKDSSAVFAALAQLAGA
jgi:hypothetical protein